MKGMVVMVKLKKTVKSLAAAVITLSLACASVPFTASANTETTTISFWQGDVNGDGDASTADVALVLRYLNGSIGASVQQVTRMDAFTNKVIEMQDYNKILDFAANFAKPQFVESKVYSAIDCTSRMYSEYDYELEEEMGDYVITANTSSAGVNSRIFETYNDYRDYENLNTVQLDLDGNIGSGFIVGEHVVATAAHCLYDEHGFCPSVEINVYNAAGTQIVQTYTPVSAHIPVNYRTHLTIGDGLEDNYDYALLYVEEDLSSHGIWSLGCMTTEFMATGSNVITSGFTAHDSVYARYYSRGNVVDFNQSETHNDKNLRFTSKAKSYGGKSGGPVYYEATYGGNTIKSVIGIGTGAEPQSNNTWGTRITPTILQFYLNNPCF